MMPTQKIKKRQQRHKTSILRILSKLLRLLGEIHLLESHDFEQPLQKDFAHFRQKISRQETLNNVGGSKRIICFNVVDDDVDDDGEDDDMK